MRIESKDKFPVIFSTFRVDPGLNEIDDRAFARAGNGEKTRFGRLLVQGRFVKVPASAPAVATVTNDTDTEDA